MIRCEVTCDRCGANLSDTDNASGYRLTIASEPLPPRGVSVTTMYTKNPMPEPAHFCGWDCLWDWARSKLELRGGPTRA